MYYDTQRVSVILRKYVYLQNTCKREGHLYMGQFNNLIDEIVYDKYIKKK